MRGDGTTLNSFFEDAITSSIKLDSFSRKTFTSSIKPKSFLGEVMDQTFISASSQPT
jgi:hypothetical protein